MAEVEYYKEGEMELWIKLDKAINKLITQSSKVGIEFGGEDTWVFNDKLDEIYLDTGLGIESLVEKLIETNNKNLKKRIMELEGKDIPY